MEAADTWAKPLQNEIERLFYSLFFIPLLKELEGVKDNAVVKKSPIIRLIDSEALVYRDGGFEGERNATISKTLKDLGATFNKVRKAWVIPIEKIPTDIRNAIAKASQRSLAHERKINDALNNIHDTVRELMPQFSFQGLSRETLLKMADRVRATIPNEMALQPKIDERSTKELNKDYTNNIQLSIVGFLDDEVLRFRNKVLPNIRKGISRKELQQYIGARLNIGRERAKFIARQETSLFTSKLKQVQYKSAGIEKYRWKAIGGSSGDGRTRESHMEANGKEFFWDHAKNMNNPFRVVNGEGQPVHPGEDFNCRCQAVPIVDEI